MPLPGAGGMVRKRTRMDKPRPARRFDDFAAMFAGEPTLAGAVAAERESTTVLEFDTGRIESLPGAECGSNFVGSH